LNPILKFHFPALLLILLLIVQAGGSVADVPRPSTVEPTPFLTCLFQLDDSTISA